MSGIGGTRFGLSRGRALLVVVLALSAAGGGVVWYALAAPDVPIIELELAGSAQRAQQVISTGAADYTSASDYTRAINADWGLIAGYVFALLAATWLLGHRVFWTPKARWVADIAAVGSVVAGAADAVENLLLYIALDQPATGPWRWVQAAAFTKFGLLAFAVPVAILAWAFTVGRLLSSLRSNEDLAADDVLPPPPLEPPDGGRLPDNPPHETKPVAARWTAATQLPLGRDPAEVGICASGGGIRSACVTLGALQSLREHGELARARYLVSVSGGGYMTGAFQLALQPRPCSIAANRSDGPAEPANFVDDPNAATAADVLAGGSAEEDHVRRHSRYVADGGREWAAALGVLLRGVTVSLALITLTVVVAGLTLSAFYRWVPVVDLSALRPRFAPRHPGPAFPVAQPGVVIAIGIVVLAAVLVYLVALVAPVLHQPDAKAKNLLAGLEWVSKRLAGLAIVLVLLGVGIPTLVWTSAQVLSWLADTGGPASTPAGGGASAVLLAYVGTLAGVLWRKRQVIRPASGKLRGLLSGRGTGGTVSAVPKALLQQLVMWLILGLLCAALLLVLGWCTGSGRAWPAWVPLVALSLFAVAVLALDQTWLGLHPFYRRRLASAFSVRRATRTDGRVVAAPYDFDRERTTLSEYAARRPGFPQVIFAGAANLSGSDRTPPGRRAVSFTLAGDWVGGPEVGWIRTASLERHVGGQLRRDLTVQAAVAISGAAFASAMGRQARAYQTFFALSNARLGAWLPNPAFLYMRHREGADWRLPRLPRLRRLTYLLREILGSFAVDDRLLFCTDGGHYENLGLVELLRHRCRLVYCIDASGDSPPFATTLAEAITLAYEELGVEITLDAPRDLVPGGANTLDPADPLAALNARLSKSGVVVGRITYPEPVSFPGLPEPSRYGAFVIAKATLPADVPYELLSYAVSNPVFPRDSTSDQWFDHRQFDAYQALGRYLGACAAAVGRKAEAALGDTAAT